MKKLSDTIVRSLYVLGLLLFSTSLSYATSLSSTPSSCTIDALSDSCQLDFTWDLTGSSDPNIYYVNTTLGWEGTLSSDVTGTSEPLSINIGTTTVQARDDESVLHSITVSASCEAGSRSNGSSCYTPDTMYGSVSSSVSACTIAFNESTCDIPFTWSITGATIYPNLYNVTRGVVYSTSTSGTDISFPITRGTNRIKMRDNNVYVDDVYVEGNCTTGTSWNGSICEPYGLATVHMTSITCTSEALLPNWIAGVIIGSTTAATYVSGHPGCSLASGWSFQWGNSGEAIGLTKDFVGEADGSLGAGTDTNVDEWKTFGPTNASGTASIAVPTGQTLKIREILQDGYIPFTYDDFSGYGGHDENPIFDDNVTAELWCSTHDAEHRYDNLEQINYATDDSHYYCIAFNTPNTLTPTISASFATSTINAGVSYSLTWTSTNATSVSASCTGNASSSIHSLTYTPAAGNTVGAATNNTMYGTTTCSLVATGAGGTATSTPFNLIVNPLCSAVTTWNGSACVNPSPSISLSPMGTTAVIGTPITFTVTGNDTGNDIDFTKLLWKAPGQSDWSYDNSNYGATVTPDDGYAVYSPTSSTSETFSFTPTVAGTYEIEVSIRDNTSTRWTSTTTSAIVVNCTTGYLDMSGTCTNPAPAVSISPGGTMFMQLGSSTLFRSTSTDASSDITVHNLTWEKPNGLDRYTPGTPGTEWGTVTYSSSTTIASGTASSLQQATFTPDHIGYYRVRFAAGDNTLSHYSPTLTDRWTYSPWTVVGVVNGTTATVIQDPGNANKIKWECFYSDKATMVTTGGPTTNDFIDRSLPPSSGSFIASEGATYTLTCTNTATNVSSVISYAKPNITTSSVTVSSVDVAYSCNNATAQSSILERTPGTSVTRNLTTGSQTDSGLTGGTEYVYTLRCYSGLGGTGTQVGAATVRVTTVVASPPAFTISAYTQRVVTDSTSYSSTTPIKSTTPDGQFYAWSYQITGGAANTCVMDQRNDNSTWYPTPGYDSATSSYTLLYSSLSAADRASFASSFSTSHYWRLTCFDNVGRSKSLTWGLEKSTDYPTVVDATLNLNCTPTPAPAITVQCANSDYYEVANNATNAIISSGASAGGVVTLPTSNATYRVVCKQGGSGGIASAGQYLRTYSANMCTTQASLTAAPRTIKAGTVTTLNWSIFQPNATCTLTASSTCIGACSAARITNENTLNTEIQTGNTDTNDPNNINGETRTVLDALRTEAFNNGISGRALGKKTLRVNNTTDFLLQCGTTTSQRARVQVINDTQG